MSAHALQLLECRRLLSISLVESEPNNTPVKADEITRSLDHTIEVAGKINALGDHDWFKIQLKKGDVFGAALNGRNGLDPATRLVNASGELMIGNDDSDLFSSFLPSESPMPRSNSETDAELYYVINKAGSYYLDVSATGDAGAGKYDLDVLVARPGMEAQPVGAKQILFLDFDGAKVDFGEYKTDEVAALGKKKIAPLAKSLKDWGLKAVDENAVIDSILVRVTKMLSTFVGAHGPNGNFAQSGNPGDFGIDIRNSRDDRDIFGSNPLVSRVAIGAINDPAFTDLQIGTAQDFDIGNFKTDDEGVATADFVTAALSAIPIQPPQTAVTFVAEALATVIVHEAGHFLGCMHTDQGPFPDVFVGAPNVMDSNNIEVIGPDFTWGTSDDIKLNFGQDLYASNESFQGLDDTLSTVAFGLSTGKHPIAECAVAASFVTGSSTFKATAATAASMTKDFLHADPDSDLLK